MGRACEREDERRRRRGRRRGIRWQRTTVPTSGHRGDGAGDGGEHCLGYAVLGRGVMRLGSVGIEGNFRFFERFLSFPASELLSSIVGNQGN
ncbi:hypothetical protein CDL15_Pgr015005 [Punica granatum]|nr:hypothetical protein CDL15_Pgr015005 [Punica granatum]